MEQANQHRFGSSLPMELTGALGDWRLGEGPLSRRLAAALREAVEQDELLPGTRLPPERLLAAQLGVARTTVSAAYQALERRGLVHRRQGRGTHVAGEEGAPADYRTAELTTSLQRNILFRRLGHAPEGTIDLVGNSAPPSRQIREAIAAAAAAVDTDELLGGPGYYPLGYPVLRRALAAHITARGLPTAEEEILITGGAQQAISLLASAFAEPAAVIVLEDPTFPGALDAFRAAGSRILTVPVHQDGVDVAQLTKTISDCPVRAAYLMPTFHNPVGTVMPEAARREVARFSRISGIPIIEDNTLAELSLGCEPPTSLAAYARAAPIVSIGSLSKVSWAGLRVGWIRAHRPVIAQLGRLKAVADLGTSLYSQAIAVRVLADLDRIRDLRLRELAGRLAQMDDLLHRELPDWRWRRPKGGLSLWARLPGGTATELAYIAQRRGVVVVPGSVMSPTGRFDDFIRLPLDHDPAVLGEGIRRLASAWKTYHGTLHAGQPDPEGIVV
jgi:DNA-binding transcriptional MocR family regulator